MKGNAGSCMGGGFFRRRHEVCVCVSAYPEPCYAVCMSHMSVTWGTAWRREGKPNTTPSQEHEASHLPADL